MALYTRESRERVRDAVDFVELVSARTELRRAGPSSYEGLCPFHDERTPSFGIDPVQKVYYCFGCQAKGDVFTFVQETENIDFVGALELLASRHGIELEREAEDPREAEKRRRRERLLELLGRTARYYERVLWESTEAAAAREYLQGRGLGEEALREFRVGYAPSAWDRVLLASRRGGFSEQELRATGLAQRSQQDARLYDRFRGRIMFPLADVRGRVLGFGARAMREEQRPKYLNTSDNDVYHKGRHLYGADLARAHAARAGEVILCEGYTDVIALHQAGLKNAVGLMGTALTDEQVGELARMASTVLLALDADSAGQEAMLRAAGLAAQRKLELRVVELPAGTDPAELLQREGVGAIEAAVRDSAPFVRFRVERILAKGETGSPEGRDRTIDELRPVFATLPPSAMRLELTRVVSERLQLPESLAETLLASTTRARTPTAPRALSRREELERTFLALCIASPEAGARALSELELDEHFTGETLRRVAAHLREGDLCEPMSGGALDGDPELAAALAELVVLAGRESPRPAMLESQRQQLELARVDRQIQAARARGSGEVNELARRRAEIKRAFDGAYERALEETGG
ncbi:MAG TPA: DNA primase [Solirubrobacteraceae bacterium]|jgi:DNA primase|nr:DNA primase [Solirubrobacteraceae bacterium]